MELFSPRQINLHKFQTFCNVYQLFTYLYILYLLVLQSLHQYCTTYISSRLGAGMGGLCYSLGRDSDLRHPYNDLWSVAGGLRQRQEIDPVSSDIHPLSHSR